MGDERPILTMSVRHIGRWPRRIRWVACVHFGVGEYECRFARTQREAYLIAHALAWQPR